jgi:competence ComEA-like helix-hairpin-helix protein
MRKISFLLTALLMLTAVMPTRVAANDYVRLTRDTTALVVRVIDGDALLVRVSNSEALVRLAGVDAMGRDDALEYMNGALLGRVVELTLDPLSSRWPGRWTPVYLTYNRVQYNRALVMRGLARADASYAGYSLYLTLAADESWARARRFGMWAVDAPYTPAASPTPAPAGERVNINTATSARITRLFSGIEYGAAGGAVVRLRAERPYQSVDDLKYAGVLTREEFEDFRELLTVCTNINTAVQAELEQLDGVGSAAARAIIQSRERAGGFLDAYELVTRGLLTESVYERNKNYISVYDVYRITAAVPDVVADLNTADIAALTEAGLTARQAEAVAAARGNGYTAKSMGELQKISGVSLTDRRLYDLSDNIRVFAPYTGYVNLNTAPRETLAQLGLDERRIAQIRSRQGRMYGGADIPFDVSTLDSYVTLYTNVNGASWDEWMGLSPDMGVAFAAILEEEARRQPFGTWAELRAFFDYYSQGELYTRISRFLTLY